MSIYCCAKRAVMATQTEGILERLRLAGMPEADIRRLIATQKSRLALRSKHPLMVRSPRLICAREMNIAKDNVVAKIQGMDPVWVTAAIPESIARLVKDALAVYAHRSGNDRIKHSPSAKWTLHRRGLPRPALQLRLEVDNADEALKPGMNARL